MSSETKLAMLRRKMEGGSRAAVEDLRRQEQDLLSMAQIEASQWRGCWLVVWPACLPCLLAFLIGMAVGVGKRVCGMCSCGRCQQ